MSDTHEHLAEIAEFRVSAAGASHARQPDAPQRSTSAPSADQARYGTSLAVEHVWMIGGSELRF
jgi:hypothetical protein